MTALPKRSDFLSVDEYLEGEEFSEERHEYFDGRTIRMEGGTAQHAEAAGYLYRKMADHLEGNPCRVFSHSLKLHLRYEDADMFYYPDLMVCCDPADNHRFYRERPKLLGEVISETNKNKDRVEKYLVYRTIPSVEEVFRFDPDPAEFGFVVARRGAANRWDETEIARTGSVTLKSIGLVIDVDALRARLEGI